MEEKIGERLKDLRKKHKLTQEELAKNLGISASTIRMIEKDLRKPSLSLLDKIAEYFNVPKSFILEGFDSSVEAFITSAQNLNNFINDSAMMHLKRSLENDPVNKFAHQTEAIVESLKTSTIQSQTEKSKTCKEINNVNITHEVIKNFVLQKKITDPENIPEHIKKIIDEAIKLEIKILLEELVK